MCDAERHIYYKVELMDGSQVRGGGQGEQLEPENFKGCTLSFPLHFSEKFKNIWFLHCLNYLRDGRFVEITYTTF